MAKVNEIPVVVLNHKADVIGYYDSLKACSEANERINYRSLTKAFQKRSIYKCMLFIRKDEYIRRYEEGTLHELQFPTLKEREKERGRRISESMTPETRKKRALNISKAMKERCKDKNAPIYQRAKERRKKVVCVQTGVVYESITAAAIANEDTPSSVHRSCTKGFKSKGYNYEYKERNK